MDAKGKTVSFHEADPDYLANTSSCWLLRPEDYWYGFDDREAGYCLLDPAKVHVTTPGINVGIVMAEQGILTYVFEKYLFNRDIPTLKTVDFSILILFSSGITRSQ